MFDEPQSKGSRLPESSRINSLLAGLMGTKSISAPAPPFEPVAVSPTSPLPTLTTQDLIEPAHAPKSATARPFSTFLKSIQWAYTPSHTPMIVVTPGMPVREFFALVNWSGDKNASPATLGGSITPPSVENLMSQFSWD